jgi:hypothetical protein
VEPKSAPGEDAGLNHIRLQRRWWPSTVGLFFNAGPLDPFPALNSGLIPFQGSAAGPLTAPAQLGEQTTDMITMIDHLESPPNPVRNPLGGPQLCAVTQGLGPFQQVGFEFEQLVGVEFGWASRPTGFPEPRQPVLLQLLLPATDRLAMHPHAAGHFGCRHLVAEQTRSLETASFQFCKIAFVGVWHARKIA